MTATNWIRLTLMRLDAAQPEAWRSAVSKSVVLVAGSTVFGALVCIGAAALVAPERFIEFGIATIVYVLANGISRLGIAILRMRENAFAISSIESIRSLLMVAGAVGACTFISPSFFHASLGTSCATLLCGLVSCVLAVQKLPTGNAKSSTFVERVRYGAPLVLLILASFFISSTDRLMLKLLTGPAAVGLYAGAYALGRQPIDIIANSIVQTSFIDLIKRFDNSGREAAAEYLKRTLLFNLALILPIVGILAAIAGPLIGFVLPRAYHSASATILPFIAIAGALANLKSYVLDNAFLVERRNWLLVATYIPPAIIVVVANLILLPRFGAIGAAFAMCIGTAVGVLIGFMAVRRFLAISFFSWEAIEIIAVSVGIWLGTAAVVAVAHSQSNIVQCAIDGTFAAIAYGCSLQFFRYRFFRKT